MARITKYIIILSLMLILFNAVGIMPDTPISGLIDWVTNPSGMSGNIFFLSLFGLTGLFVAGAIALGTITPGKIDIAILSGLVMFILTILIWDFVAIFGVVKDNLGIVFATLLFSPFIVAFGVDVVSWWMGRQ